MGSLQWGSSASLKELLLELVKRESMTGTKGEQDFSHDIKNKLLQLHYFQHHPTAIKLVDAKKSRYAITALYTSKKTKKTIVLMSHYDTVHIEAYGDLKDVAFQPDKLTTLLHEKICDLSEEVKRDLHSEEYLFGRGVMDMKMGLALHMQLLEKATVEKWPINILLVTVPDEEVNSAGMRAVIPEIVNLCETDGLDIELFLNGEPSFSQYPNDKRHHIYSGSIGKIMPAALFYGRETHAGEPFNGMTGQFIASFLTRRMEWNPQFKENHFGETTPLPVTLQQRDLKEDYSTQTSHRAAALYNVFMMNKNAEDIMVTFREIAKSAAEQCNETYEAICSREGVTPIGNVRVIDFAQLYNDTARKLQTEAVETLIRNVEKDDCLDDREKAIRIVDEMMFHNRELAPAIVLFFAPPYYPAVNSSHEPFIQEKISLLQKIANEQFNYSMNQVHYFNGISDLSYVNYTDADDGWHAYKENTPNWGSGYDIPFTHMKRLEAPVLNVGPFGKDAHKFTERLHKESAFVHVPKLLEELIKSMWKGDY